ncbi:MAG: hypothetical protein ACOC45_08485, partial [Alkalispirochaetaceae bacterium]
MKRSVFLYGAIILAAAIVLMGCAEASVDPANPDGEPPAILPVTGFATTVASGLSSSGVVMPGDLSELETIWALSAPQVTGLVANTSGVTVGESYTTTLLGQELSVAISSDGDNLVYRGDLPEDSGFLEFRYNTASDTFQYEHLIYVENYPEIGELIVWAKVEDGVVNPSDQTFRGVYELA